MHRHALRPSPWQRRGLVLVAVLLLVSGAGWLGLHYSVGGGSGELPDPAEPWLMKLHGAAAFAALFAAGMMAGHHIPTAWRQARRPRHSLQRRSGLLLCGTAALVVLTGYALYYLVPDTWRATLGWLHASAGAMLVGTGIWHGAHRRLPRPGAPPA
jgi:hypothetical protein